MNSAYLVRTKLPSGSGYGFALTVLLAPLLAVYSVDWAQHVVHAVNAQAAHDFGCAVQGSGFKNLQETRSLLQVRFSGIKWLFPKMGALFGSSCKKDHGT